MKKETEEVRKIKWTIQQAWNLKSSYCFVDIDGKEAMLRPRSIACNWLDRATIEDFRRIAIY